MTPVPARRDSILFLVRTLASRMMSSDVPVLPFFVAKVEFIFANGDSAPVTPVTVIFMRDAGLCF